MPTDHIMNNWHFIGIANIFVKQKAYTYYTE